MTLNLLKILTFTLIVPGLVLLPIAHAQDAVPIEEGEPAPYSGTLLTNEAAASLLTQIQTCKEQGAADLQFQLERQTAECTLQTSLLNIQIETQQSRYDNIIHSQNQQLDFLLEARAPSGMSKEVTFVLGILSGVAITTVAAYSLSAASSAN